MSEHHTGRAMRPSLRRALPAAAIASILAVGVAAWSGIAGSDELTPTEARESDSPLASRHDPCLDLDPTDPEAQSDDSGTGSPIESAGLSDRVPASFYEDFQPGGFTCLTDVKSQQVEAVLQTFFPRDGSRDVAAVVLDYGTGTQEKWVKYLSRIDEYAALDVAGIAESTVVGLAESGSSGERFDAAEASYRTEGGTTSMWQQVVSQHTRG